MTEVPTTPEAALDRLLEGNRRFVAERCEHGSGIDARRRRQVAGGQAPFAAVLCCADSRVSPSLVFDAGIGDLFTCRNAGNQLDALTGGSLEFGVEHAGCKVVAVLGHSSCGAVSAAVAAAAEPDAPTSPNLADVVRRLLPTVLSAQQRESAAGDLVEAAGRLNVARVCQELRDCSSLLRDAEAAGRVGVAGLWYDLNTGEVEVVVPLVRS